MKKIGYVCFFIFLAAASAGCATSYLYYADPIADSVEKPEHLVRFEPRRATGQNYFDAFTLAIENRTEKEFKIDWENSFYTFNGKPHGRFGWEGMTAEELKHIKKLPLVSIPPGGTFRKEIFPLKLVGYETLANYDPNAPTFSRGILPGGRNGIRLAIMAGQRKIEENLTVEIIKKEENR